MPSAVDTNVLVRFLVDDGSAQVAAAQKLFSTGRIFVSHSVMLETEWVLRSNFGFKRSQICDAFDRLLGYPSVVFQEMPVLENAVEMLRSGIDFADALHLNAAIHCEAFYTFDRKLLSKAKRSPSVPSAREPQATTRPRKSP